MDKNALDEEKKKVKIYLTISLTGEEFKCLNRSTKSPKEIWEALEEEFVPTEEDNMYELEEKFKYCTMEDNYSNLIYWFNRLDEINMKLSNIDGGKYIKR